MNASEKLSKIVGTLFSADEATRYRSIVGGEGASIPRYYKARYLICSE
jgi:hypothetical protein